MALVSIPPGATWTVIDNQTINYNDGTTQYGTNYTGIAANGITLSDGTFTDPGKLIAAAGGATYQASELKACVLVQGYDTNNNNAVVFTMYSNNSASVGKNDSSQIPGGAWITMFDFINPNSPAMGIWINFFTPPGGTYAQGLANFLAAANIVYGTSWIGFQINYGTSEERSYVMTQQNLFDEESVPTNPVNIDVTLMHGAQLSGAFMIPPPVTVNPPNSYAWIGYFNLYRSVLTNAGTAVFQKVPLNPYGIVNAGNPALPTNIYQFPLVVYVYYPNGTTSPLGFQYQDNTLDQNLLQTLDSTNWDPPPPRGLLGLTSWKNGIMVAYSGNTLYFCEPYQPFTFPTEYQISLPFNIIGITCDETTLLVLTQQAPFAVLGSHPSNLVYEQLKSVQAALYPAAQPGSVGGLAIYNPTRAFCRTPTGTIYACREGLVMVSSGSARMLGRTYFTRQEWDARYAAKFSLLRMNYFDGQVLGYFDGDPTNGFLLGVTDDITSFVEYNSGGTQRADFILPVTDSLYVVTYVGGVSTISRFADETMPTDACTFWTREFELEKPENFGILALTGAGGNCTATVYADGVAQAPMLFTFPTQLNQIVERLPSGFKARRWSVLLQLASGVVISEVFLSGTRLELMSAPAGGANG